MTKNEKTTPRKNKGKKEAKFHTPPNTLKKKVGSGGLPPAKLAQAQEYIDTNKTDFTPFAVKILAELEKATAQAKKSRPAGRDAINKITTPIMQMKASGGMFRYMLASDIAAIILDFLESIDELNDDGFNIVDVHYRTLELIIKHKLTGNGGREGQAMAKELYDACRRYEKKHSADE